MQRKWQTGVSNSTLVFSGVSSITDFRTKMAVKNHQIFRQFQTEVIKIKTVLDRILLYANTDCLPMNFLVG